MNYRDGDVLMLTAGICAGCLVIVQQLWEKMEEPFYPDELCRKLSPVTATYVSWHNILEGPLPIPHVKLGRL